MLRKFKFALASAAVFTAAALLILFSDLAATLRASAQSAPAAPSYLGFDRNDYPGDDAMKTLRHDFAFASFWLSPPPGDKTNTNTWAGKRAFLLKQGFGFVVLFSGPDSHELQNEAAAKQKGAKDARAAAASAKLEGFAPGTIIFLDIEEGGRLPAAYHVYLKRYTEQLEAAGFRSGAYCSAIP